MSAFLHALFKYAVILLLYPFRLFPVRKNRIVMLSDLTGRYAGNPKYLTEYLLKNRPGRYELFFALASPAPLPDGVKAVRAKSLPYYYYALTAGVFVTDSGGISYMPFRKKQIVINTWHGGGAYKKFNLDFLARTPSPLREARLNEKKTTWMLASCEKARSVYRTAMLIPAEKLLFSGSPRCDILFSGDEKAQEIKEKLGLAGKKLCLYAPTFRRSSKSVFSGAVGADYAVDPEALCRALHDRFGGDWVFAFRWHPKLADRRGQFGDAARDFSDYDDMQELLLAADVLINDYSSSMWDFALTGKPCFLFCEDIADYRSREDFYTPISEWPFPLAETMAALEKNIRALAVS